MREKLSMLAISLIVFFTGIAAFADVDSDALKNSGVTIDTIMQAAEKLDFKNVKEIELDNENWKLKTQANNIEITYVYNLKNSKFKEVKKEKENDSQPPADLKSLKNSISAAKTEKGKGYIINSVESDGSCWKVEGLDSNHKEYEILVNKKNYKILYSDVASLDD